MDREKIKEILKKIKTAPNTYGVIGNERESAINALSKSVPITWFEQFSDFVLEEAAEHFDKRGKYKDGSWCDGWYEPSEPGEIIKQMKILD